MTAEDICPVCASMNVSFSRHENALICRDCGTIYAGKPIISDEGPKLIEKEITSGLKKEEKPIVEPKEIVKKKPIKKKVKKKPVKKKKIVKKVVKKKPIKKVQPKKKKVVKKKSIKKVKKQIKKIKIKKRIVKPKKRSLLKRILRKR